MCPSQTPSPPGCFDLQLAEPTAAGPRGTKPTTRGRINRGTISLPWSAEGQSGSLDLSTRRTVESRVPVTRRLQLRTTHGRLASFWACVPFQGQSPASSHGVPSSEAASVPEEQVSVVHCNFPAFASQISPGQEPGVLAFQLPKLPAPWLMTPSSSHISQGLH